MSLQLSPKAPSRNETGSSDETWNSSRPTRARIEAREESSFGVSCVDVLDEVRLRMASRGFSWE